MAELLRGRPGIRTFRAKLGHMKLHPRVTKTAVELVKRFEGLRRRAARLPDGAWTIGYGHTLSAREGAEVTPDEAELLLYYDLSEVATKLEAWTFTTLNQNQFEALTAFAFNIGLDNFRRSTVLKRVNEGQHLQAAAAMELWRKTEVDGEDLVADALVRRRAAEKAHYLTPPEGFRPSPSQVLRPVFDFSVIQAAAQTQVAQHATVIDAPLEGDEAIASVETPAAKAEAPAEGASPVQVAGEQVTEKLQGVLAEAAPVQVLHAPEGEAEPLSDEPAEQVEPDAPQAAAEPHAETSMAAQPANEAEPPHAPLFQAQGAAPSFGFRGFEPPPSRFGRPGDAPPAPANEPFGSPFEAPAVLPASSEPTTPEPADAAREHPGDFNLFDRPLAPPPPPTAAVLDQSNPPPRTMRLRGDVDDEAAAAMAQAKPARSPIPENALGGILQNRTVLWASVGCLGVLFFALAITSMLIGKATVAHLAIGFLGIILIAPASVYFLLRRTGGEASEHAPAVEPIRNAEGEDELPPL